MGRIVAGLGLSHVPSVGPVVDRGRQQDPAWKPLFDAYVPVREWLAQLRPDVAIVVYDGYPGGAGIAELGFEAADRHLAATLDVVGACACSDGCPSCVQSPKCGNWNEPLDKPGAAALLRNCL